MKPSDHSPFATIRGYVAGISTRQWALFALLVLMCVAIQPSVFAQLDPTAGGKQDIARELGGDVGNNLTSGWKIFVGCVQLASAGLALWQFVKFMKDHKASELAFTAIGVVGVIYAPKLINLMYTKFGT